MYYNIKVEFLMVLFTKITSAKRLRSVLATSLAITGMSISHFAFADGKATYNPLDESLNIPVVHAGQDQYSVNMKYESSQNRFVLTDLNLVSALTFKDRTTPDFTKTLTLSEMLDSFTPVDIEVFEFIENRQMTFRGFPTRDLFDSVYGDEWRQKEQLVFTALDGFQSSIPVENFIKYNSYVTYGYSDVKKRPQFILVKGKDAKYVELGPFFLVWDNLTNSELQARTSYGWPYQLVSFEFAKFSDLYPNSAPPADSTDGIVTGFQDTLLYCMTCHKVNGDGSKKAHDIILSDTVTNLSDDRLKTLMLDANALPEVSGMIIREEISNREQIADGIINYLRAIDANR